MDENNIQMVWEDLTEDFQALAKIHTTEIGNLLKEFNDDQLLLLIETEQAFEETLSAKAEDNEMKTAPDQEEKAPTPPATRLDNEHKPNFLAKQNIQPESQPTISIASKEDTTVQTTPKGILDILTKDWEYHNHFDRRLRVPNNSTC